MKLKELLETNPHGYHLFHEYFYHQLCKNRYKKSDPLG